MGVEQLAQAATATGQCGQLRAVHAQGGTCLLVGDDRQWIAEASKLAVAALGCTPVTEPLFHVPTGGAHDQETFNHEPYEIKCAGGDATIRELAHPLLSAAALLSNNLLTVQAHCNSCWTLSS